MDFEGVIIEESLEDKAVLKNLVIKSTKVEPVTEQHHTPHLKQWILHTVLIPSAQAEEIANHISASLTSRHGNWYADFKNDTTHYIIFRDKVFKVDRSQPDQYKPVEEHGLSIGIPDYQLDFSPDIKEWERPI
jgi:hypothetical protein